MTKVTKESLAENIGRMEKQQRVFGLALKEEYQLAAYRMLLKCLPIVESGPSYWVTYNRNPDPNEFDDTEHSHSGPESCARRIAKEIGGTVCPVYYGPKENP